MAWTRRGVHCLTSTFSAQKTFEFPLGARHWARPWTCSPLTNLSVCYELDPEDRSFLPAQGLALGMVHLDVLPARPGQAKCPGRWALEPVLLAQWPGVRCTRKSRCLLVRLAITISIAWSLISFYIARGSADWPSRWPRGKSPTLQGDWE